MAQQCLCHFKKSGWKPLLLTGWLLIYANTFPILQFYSQLRVRYDAPLYSPHGLHDFYSR